MKQPLPIFSRVRINNTWQLLASLLFLSTTAVVAQTGTQTFSTAGAHTFTVPPGVTSITVKVWGAGASGGGNSNSANGGGGGGGGAYSQATLSPVTPGTVYNIEIGAGGTGQAALDGVDGGMSWFSADNVVMAVGGKKGIAATGSAGGAGGAGGLDTDCVANGTSPATNFGGGGGTGRTNGSGRGGGGGGSAGSTGDGGTGGNGGGSVGTGGTAGAGGGAVGGAGGDNNSNGANGNAPGAGGGGSGDDDSAPNRSGGNGADGRVEVTYTDATAPTVTVNQNDGQADPTNGTMQFKVVFSEAINPSTFANSDVTLTGTAGTKAVSNLTTSDNITWIVTVTAASSGTMIANIAASAVQDFAGNNNTASTSTDNSITYDNAGPTVTVNQAGGQADPTNGNASFTIVFNEAINPSSFIDGDVTLGGTATGKAIVSRTTSDNITWTLVVSASGDGTIIPSLAASAVQDALGNNSAASTSTDNSVTIDKTVPTVAINQAGGQADPTNGDATFTIVFSEAINPSSFADGDITLGGTATGTNIESRTTSDNITWTLVISATGDGTVIPSLAASVVQDPAGNNNTASTSTDNSVTIDKTAPTVTINQAGGQNDPTNSNAFFTIVFSEAMDAATFTGGDITLGGTATGQAVANLTTSDNTTWTLEISATADGTIQPSLAANVAKDPAGNNTGASTSTDNTVTRETVVPTVTINQAGGQADPDNSSVFFTIVFSEAINASTFANSDITLGGTATGQAIQARSTSDNITWSLEISATGDGTIIPSLAANVVQDPAGNNNTASTSTDNSVTVDVTSPSVTINQEGSQVDPTTGTTAVFTIVFSEAILPGTFATSDLTLAGTATGQAIDDLSTVDNITWNLTISAASDGTVIPSLDAGKVTDAIGNSNTASTSTDNTVTLDNVGPDVTLDQDGSQADPANGNALFTIVFSEAIDPGTFDGTDITLAGTAGGQAVEDLSTSDNITWTLEISATSDGSVEPSIAAAVAQDFAGLDNTASTSTDNSVTLDVTKPDVYLDQDVSQTDPTNVATVLFAVVFSEEMDDATFTSADVTLGGTATGQSVSDLSTSDNITWALEITVTGDGTVIPSIGAGLVQDVLGNTNNASISADNTVTVDTTPPDVTINEDAAQDDPTNGNAFFTIVFSEAIDPGTFDGSDISIGGTSGGTVEDLFTSDNITWTVEISGAADGTLEPTLAPGVAQDFAGNDNTGSTSTDNSVTIDKTSPDVTIDQAGSQNDPTNTNALFTIVFNEAIDPATFDDTDITLGGTATGQAVEDLTTSDNITWTLEISVTGDGTIQPSIAVSVAQDPAGNDNNASSSTDNTVTLESVQPSVTINEEASQADPTNGNAFFTIVFSEEIDPSTFADGDITLGGTAAGRSVAGRTTSDNITWTLEISTTGDGTVIPSLAANSVTDPAGNNNTASTSTDNTVTIDKTKPNVTINQAGGQDDPTNGNVLFTIVFSEAIDPATFDATDISLGGTAPGMAVEDLSTSNNITWTLEISTTGDGTVVPSLAANVAQDPAGNDNNASSSTDNTVTVDKTAPTVTINQAGGQNDPTNTDASFTIVFSEAIDPGTFAGGDITFGGTASGQAVQSLTTSNNITWTLVISVTGDGTIEPSIAASAAQDPAGNNNTASTSTDNTVTLETVQPSVTINEEASQADPTNGNATFTIVFSEAINPSTFANGDITLGGTAAGKSIVARTTSDNITWTLEISTTGDGTVIPSLAANVVQDPAGNNNTASTSTDNSVTVDKTAPTLTINQAGGQVDPFNGNVLFTIVFSEAIDPATFDATDISLAGTAGGKTVEDLSTANNITWTLEISATSDGTITPSIAANVAQDPAGNNNTASSSTDNTVTVDVTAPTVTINQAGGQLDPTNGNAFFTIVFSEAIDPSTFAGGDISLGGTATGQAVEDLTTSDNITWTLEISATADGTIVPSIAASAAQDPVDNFNTASTSTDNSVTKETVQPSVTINEEASQVDPANSNVLFTIVFSEAINPSTFASNDITLGGTAGGKTVEDLSTSDNITWLLEVSATSSGTIIPSIAANRVQDPAGNNNTASTSTDNTVTYDIDLPTVSSIEVPDAPGNTALNGIGTTNGTSASSITYVVTFSEDVSGLDASDFTLSAPDGSSGGYIAASATVASVSPASGPEDVYTITVNSITGTGRLRLDLLPSATVLDNAGNDYNATFNTGETYSIVFAQPSNHVTGVSASAVTDNYSIQVSWTNPASPAVAATHYLVRARGQNDADVTGSFPSVTDGTYAGSDDTNFSDGSGFVRISATNTSHTFSTLLSGKDYDFEVIPYTLSANNSSDNVNYLVDGNQSLVSATSTTGSAGTLTAGSTTPPTEISSLSTSYGSKNFTFKIKDDGASNGVDDARTRFTQLVIYAGTSNTVTDWSDVIAEAELKTTTEATTITTTTIGTNTITFTTSTSDNAEGELDDNEEKEYELRIRLKGTLSNNANLTADGQVFDFIVGGSNPYNSFTYHTSSSEPSRIGSAETESSGGAYNEIDVDATAITFSSSYGGTQPPATAFVLTNLTASPVARAVDANGNTDIDFTTTLNITNTGSLPMSQSTIAVDGGNGGRYTFPTNFQYTDLGAGSATNGTLTLSNGGSVTGNSSGVTVSYSNTTTITASATLVEPATISSVTTTSSGTSVFDFTVNDDANTGGDGSPTRISQVIITPGTGNEIGDWSQLIESAQLSSGASTISASSITASAITFSGIDIATLGLVGDNASRTYTLAITFLDTPGGTLPDDLDNQKLAFRVEEDDITLSSQSSLFVDNEAEESGNGNIAVLVEATRLRFTTQPPALVMVNFNLSTSPIVEAQDFYGNRDVDYEPTTGVTVTNADGLGMINMPTSFTDGVLTFPGGFQYEDIGDGTLTVASSANATNGFPPNDDAVSDAVEVRAAISATITAGGDAEPTTISSLENSNPADFQVFDFTITDDAGSEDDGNDMQVTYMYVTYGTGDEIANATDYNWVTAIEDVVLTDGTNSVVGSINNTYFYFDLSLTAEGQNLGKIVDDGSQTFKVLISLKSNLGTDLAAEIDGLNFVFDVQKANIGLSSTSSQIIALETENSGSGNNEVSVVATEFEFDNINPVGITVTVNSDVSVSLRALDNNGNLDLDFAEAVTTITNASTLDTNPDPATSASFANGELDFDFQYNQTGNGQLTISTATVSNQVSPAINVIASFESQLYIDPSFTFLADLDYKNYQDISTTPYTLSRYILSDGDADGVSGDQDGAPTILESFTVSITNPTNVKRIAVFDDTGTQVASTETDGAAAVVFTGAPLSTALTAPDDGSKTFTIRASFESGADITDGDLIQLAVTAATVASSGTSEFRNNVGDIGGVSGGAVTAADKNIIDVDATEVRFVQEPTDVLLGVAMSPSVTLETTDVLGTRDLDYTGTMSITSDGVLASTTTASISSGFATASVIHSDKATNRTLTAATGSLTDAVSTFLFDVIASANGDIIADNSFTPTSNILYKDYQATDITSTNDNIELARFIIRDDQVDGIDDDNAGTLVDDITFAVTNHQLLRSVALYDDSGNEIAELAPSATMAFNNLNGGLGYGTADNGTRTLTIRASFLNTSASITDNLRVGFEVTSVVPTSKSSNFTDSDGGGATSSTTGDQNRIEVVATQYVFTTAPTATIFVDVPFSPGPLELEARDDNNVIDLDYAEEAAITNADNIPMSDVNNSGETSIPISFVAGVLTFENDFRYDIRGGGNGTLTLTGPDITLTSSAIAVNVSGSSDIVEATFTYPTDIDYLDYQATDINLASAGDEIELARFTIRDGGAAANDADNADTELTEITFNVTNPDLIDRLAVYSGGTELGEVSVSGSTVTVGPFSTLTTDNGTRTLNIYATFKDVITDNEQVTITIADAVPNSDYSVFAASNAGGATTTLGANDNKMEVIATFLRFTNPPTAANASLNVPFTPVTIEARDINENLDLDFVGTISALTNTESLTMVNTPATNSTVPFVAGEYALSSTFQYTTEGTQSAGNGTLSMTAGGISGTSESITVAASYESRVYIDPTYTQTNDVQYINYQATDILNTGTSFEITRLRLSDGDADGVANDADGASTILTGLTLSVTNSQAIRRIALYNGSSEVQELDGSAFSGGSISFTGVNVTAADNNFTTLGIRVSFKNNATDIVDNNLVQVSVTGATLAVGSQFLIGAGTTAGTPTANLVMPSTANHIEVVATQLDFTTQPPANAFMYANLTTTPVVQARDANAILDADYTNPVGVTSSVVVNNAAPGGLPVSDPSLQIVNGVLTFPTTFQYLDNASNYAPANGHLTVTSPTLNQNGNTVTAVTSSTVNVTYSNITTIAAAGFLSPLTISSLSTAAQEDVFAFTITEDNAQAISDGSPTRISQIVITPGTGNDALLTNWTDIISSATLQDGTNSINGTIAATSITFATDITTLGLVGDNATKTYTLSITVRDDLNAALQDVVDNKRLVFEILRSNITLTNLSSTIASGANANSGTGNNAVDVVTTQLTFTTPILSDVLVSKNIGDQPSASSPVPVIEALDIHGNRDLDYDAAVVTTNNNSLTMVNAPSSITDGLLTFAAGFQYTSIDDGSTGNGTLTITSSTANAEAVIPTAAVSSQVTVRVATSGTITVGGVTEPPTFSSLTDALGEQVTVFDFTINDDPGGTPAIQNDGNPILISSITVSQSTDNTILDWTEAIAYAELVDAADGTKVAAGLVNQTTLTFTGLTQTAGELGYVGDNASKTYRLKIYLRQSLGGSLPITIDGLKFGFEVLEANISVSPNGTAIIDLESENSGNNNVVTVVATQLDVTTPAVNSFVSINTIFTPVVEARDINKNRDLDFEGASGTVTEFVNAGAVTMSNGPVVSTTQFNNGILDFAVSFPNFQFTSGDNNEVVTLTMKAGTGTNCGSNAVCTVITPVLTLKTNTITSGSLAEPSSVSSLETSAFVPVFDFTINDDDNETQDTDGVPTQISQLVITPLAGNDIADWTDLIAAADLRDDDGNVIPAVNVAVNPTNITFSSINFSSNALGYIADNDSKTYTLYLTLKTALGGTLPSTVDNLNLAFNVTTANITVNPGSSTFSASESENSGASNNAIDVVTTLLVFSTDMNASLLVNKDISLQQSVPVVEALDIYNNRDLDYNSPITTTNTQALGMNNDPTSIASGILTFNPAFEYTTIGDGTTGNGTLTLEATTLAANGQAPSNAVSAQVTVRVGISATITAGTLNEPATISSLDDTNGEKVAVFDFKLSDDPGLAPNDIENDGNPILIDEIIIRQSSDNTIPNWSKAIAFVELVDAADGTKVKTGVVDSAAIYFSSLTKTTGELGYIADNDDKTYRLRLYLRSSLLGNLPLTIDGQKFGFEVVEDSIDTDPTGTSFINGQATASGDNNEVTVVATQLDFVAQDLDGFVSTYTDLDSLYFVVHARDVNENLDLDYGAAVSDVSNTENLSVSVEPFGNFVAGIFDFETFDATDTTNFQFTQDSGPDDIQLTVESGSLTPAVSQLFKVAASFESFISKNLPRQDIDYLKYNAEDIDQTSSTDRGVTLERLTLHDGNVAGLPDDIDGATTTLTSLTLGVTNPQSIKRIALYTRNDAGTWNEEDEQPGNAIAVTEAAGALPAFGQITFSGLSIVAADHDTTNVHVIVTFDQTADSIVDNSLFQVMVLAATSAPGSRFRGDVGDPDNTVGDYIGGLAISQPAFAPAGTDAGAIGEETEIEVIATRLDFTTQPAAIEGIFQPLITDPVVKARDANMVVDLDINSTATIASDGFKGDFQNVQKTGPKIVSDVITRNFVNGILDFSGIRYDTAGVGTFVVTTSSPSLSSLTGGSQSCSLVDAVHVLATVNQNGLKVEPRLRGGTTNAVIFGTSMTLLHRPTNVVEPGIEKISIVFDRPYETSSNVILKNFRFFETTDAGYNSGSSALISLTSSGTGATVTKGQSPAIADDPAIPNTTFDMVTVSFATPRRYPTDKNVLSYFMMVDVDVTANISTPSLTPMLVDMGYGSNTYRFIDLTTGTATADSLTRVDENGNVVPYTFASTRPPSLVGSYPRNGQLNVDSLQNTVSLDFDVAVWSLDHKIEIYDRYSDQHLGTLTAQNGKFDPIRFNPNFPDAIPDIKPTNTLMFSIPDSVKLYPDSVYYIKIANGVLPNTNSAVGATGISDDGYNLYGGLSHNGGLYFKIASKNPPLMTDTQPTKYYLTQSGGAINASFTQFGKAYFLIVRGNHTSPLPKSVVKSGGVGLGALHTGSRVITSGTFDIKQIDVPQYGSFYSPDLKLDSLYQVWIYAENDALPEPIGADWTYGEGDAFEANTSGPTFTFKLEDNGPEDVTTYINRPTYQICANSYTQLADPLIIAEKDSDQFNLGTNSFNVILPNGFQFVVDSLPNVQFFGADFDASFVDSLKFQFVNNTILRITYNAIGIASKDLISISDLYVFASAANLTGDIKRFAGNAIPELDDEEVLARVVSTASETFSFTNTYTTQNAEAFARLSIENAITYIPDNFIDLSTNSESVRLIPQLSKGDYGPSSFSGSGVTNDVLSLSGVSQNTSFNITMTHTDMNGCVSNEVVQYQVYDHTSAIPALGTKEAITNTSFPSTSLKLDSDTIGYASRSGFKLIRLYADLPEMEDSTQIMYGDDWQTVVARIPDSFKDFDDATSPEGKYRTYKWDYSHILNADTTANDAIVINPYNHFADTTINNSPYWKGGSLGIVEFTGHFQSTADPEVRAPFKQQVEIYVPPIPAIEVSQHAAVDAGTLVFCNQQSGDIQFNGYPPPTPGVSTGVFVIQDATLAVNNDAVSTNDVFITAKGFTDNKNGTAIIEPDSLYNNHNAIRVIYTFKEFDNPKEGSDTVLIRIEPNPNSEFSIAAEVGSHTPFTNSYCATLDGVEFNINFTAVQASSISEYNWNFGDPNSGPENVATGAVASHNFDESESYLVSLTTVSVFNCVSQVENAVINVGVVPEVDFELAGVVSLITFEADVDLDDSSVPDGVATYRWNFGNGQTSTPPTALTAHQYNAPGVHNVTLEVTSQNGCRDSYTRPVVILPTAKPTNANTYSANFEVTGTNWQTFATLREDDEFVRPSTWKRIRARKTFITSSANDSVWTTGAVRYDTLERSALYTPVFDLTGLARPIVTFDSYSRLASNDGVVLEFSTDSLNVADPDKKWTALGQTTMSDDNPSGVNWYTASGLLSKPGNQETGDFGWAGSDTGWKQSKHKLSDPEDMNSSLNAYNRIVFRFALASAQSDPAKIPDGFAINNFRIGNGTRSVLVENFTNANGGEPARVVRDSLFNFVDNSNVEVVKVNYHVPFPIKDAFNEFNPDDPGSRATYYGISTLPNTRLDGMDYSTAAAPSFAQWSGPAFTSRILDLAEMRIDTLFLDKNDPDAFEIVVEFTPTIRVSNNPDSVTLLHVLVVEDESTLAGSDYHYVMRHMLPNAAGTRFTQLDRTKYTVRLPWNEPAASAPNSQLSAIAFLQDEKTKTIYQARLVPSLTDPTVVTRAEIPLDETVHVFPNPADQEMTIQLIQPAREKNSIVVFDQMGRIVREVRYDRGDQATTIDTSELSGGMYLIKVGTDRGIVVKKVLVTHRH